VLRSTEPIVKKWYIVKKWSGDSTALSENLVLSLFFLFFFE